MQPDEHFGHWFAGFTDGEGCFSIDKIRISYICKFTIALRVDDMPILEEIRARFQIGEVYHLKPRNQSRAAAILRVARMDDVLKLVSILNRYPLRAKKRNDYIIWRDAVALWTGRRGHHAMTSRGPHPVQSRLAELAAELSAQRRMPDDDPE